MKGRADPIGVSVVVPIYNEAESIPHLLAEIDAALRPTGRTFEVILIDDGSTDGSWAAIREGRRLHPELVGIQLLTNRGQTAALMAGFHASRGEAVVTLDGDLQNDPADIPKLLDKLEEGYEIVSGWRRRRKDKLLSRRFPSVVANRLARWLTGITIHDNGCALKAYRGGVLRSVSLYSEFHRFIVPLAQMGGGRVAEVETNHRARRFGSSKYGLTRVLKVAADLMTLIMVTRYSDRLLLWFLLFAVPFLVLGLAAGVWAIAAVAGNPDGPPPLVATGSCLLLFQAFLAIVGYGLFAERIRHLAGGRDRGPGRVLATVCGRGRREPTTLLIRDLRADPLSGDLREAP